VSFFQPLLMLTTHSLHIPALPLVFLVSTSSPTPSAFIQASYSRATLALLRIRYFGIPSGLHVLDEILARVSAGAGYRVVVEHLADLLRS
jgi:hypothetical protein